MISADDLMKNLNRAVIPAGIYVINFMAFKHDGEYDKENHVVDYYSDSKPFSVGEAKTKIQSLIEKDFQDTDNVEIKFTESYNILSTEEEYKMKKDDTLDKEMYVAEALQNGIVLKRYFMISAM